MKPSTFILACLCLTACAPTRAGASAAPLASAPTDAGTEATLAASPSALPARTIRVSGRARDEARPDLAVISLGVDDRAKTARDAAERNARHMAKIMDTLRSAGIDARDIQTAELSISEDYGLGGRVKGFFASNIVTVKVRDLARTGAVLDAAIDAGADRVHSVGFALDDTREHEHRVLAAAMDDARKRGEGLAGGTDGKLGRILSVDTVVAPRYDIRYATMTEGADIPIAPGTLSTEVEVVVVFELLG